jgi:hypothetical protein
VLALELLNEVVDETVVKVFSTKMRVTGSGLDLKDTLLDSQERYIESSSTQVENENVPFAGNLLIVTVRDSGGSRFIDDTMDVETTDCTGSLRGLTSRVVKVGRDRDNRICNSATKVRLGVSFIFTRTIARDFLGGL